jgi:hypothetical protein
LTTVDEEDGMRGGSEGDIRSLYYWSWMALITLLVSIGIWVALGAYSLWNGLFWMERDADVGLTTSTSNIVTGIGLLVVAVATGLLLRLVYLDVHLVFAQRRFQVPREKLLVYGFLALPFGFVISGVLLLLINWKLSFPQFLPSHAEAYPDAMPGFVQVPRAMLTAEVPVEALDAQELPADAPVELAPLGFDTVPVSDEEAQPAPEFFGEQPAPAGPYEPLPAEVPEPAQVPAAVPATAPTPAITEAYVEEVPVEEIPGEEIPEVMAEVTPAEPPTAQYEEVDAVVEEVPQEAVVETYVEEVPGEEVPGEGGEGFELVEAGPGEEEGPKTIEEAHEELLGKLLGK